LPVDEVAARLDDAIGLLVVGARAAPPRHRTLEATIDWSHRLLGELERALLRRLSVFAGGWTIAAAEAVCAGGPIARSDVLDLLTGLVDRSLVQTGGGGVEGRYRFLDTVRQYAEQKLRAAGEAEQVRAQHREWCLSLMRQADGRSLKL